MIGVIALLALVRVACAVLLDLTTCGLDAEPKVFVGDVSHETYPWYGVLYYVVDHGGQEVRSVTPVVLIHEGFLLASAADIGPMPKDDFRDKTRVLLGVDWHNAGRAVKSYVIHPEYGDTVNTLALVQLAEPVIEPHIKPICPPPNLIKNPEFYVARYEDDDFNVLRKRVLPVTHVPGEICKSFYIRSQLYSKRHRPPHVTCSTSLLAEPPCVWGAGAALVMRDPWGRWQLLGFGARGPGCGAPARFMDIISYWPWIEESLDKFRSITVTQLDERTAIYRQGRIESDIQRFGDCDASETAELLYRDYTKLESNKKQKMIAKFRMTLKEPMRITCLRASVQDGTMTSSLRILHRCPQNPNGACYNFKETATYIVMKVWFERKVRFQLSLYGHHEKKLELLNMRAWREQEGLSYKNFSTYPEEYRPSQDEEYFGIDRSFVKPTREDMMYTRERERELYSYYGITTTTTTTPAPKKSTREELRKLALERNKEIDLIVKKSNATNFGYFYRDQNRMYKPVYYESKTSTYGKNKNWRAYGYITRGEDGNFGCCAGHDHIVLPGNDRIKGW